MNRQLVSIIIPIYNVEKYLDQCIESVINQTYDNLEIITIDDGSTDDSLKIIERYKKLDNRINVISRENRGQGSCRNFAMDIIKGKYVLFIDSDDYLDEKCIETLLNKIEDENAEIVMYNALAFDDFTEEKKFHKSRYFNLDSKYINTKMKGIDFSKETFDCISPCLKLYNANFLKKNNIRFDEGRFGEDVLFWNKCLLSVNSIIFIDYIGYFRRYRPNSVMTCGLSKVTKDRISSLNDFYDLVDELDDSYNIFKINLSNYAYAQLNTILIYDELEIKELVSLFKKVKADKIICKYSNSNKYKFKTRLLCINYRMFILLKNIKNK